MSYYINGNRNGTSKTLYTNASNEIKIELGVFVSKIEDFLGVEDKIAYLISNIASSTGMNL